MELPLSELELELNCLLDWVPDSELEWGGGAAIAFIGIGIGIELQKRN